MPTDNPKISLYVPRQIYNRFREFQKEQELSMSQAGIVILAEYFGIKESIREITEGTTIGGVTLAEFEELKERIAKLEKQVEQKQTTSELLEGKRQSLEKNQPSETGNRSTQLNLIHEEEHKTQSISARLLAERLGIRPNSISSAKSRRKDENDFYEWSKSKDSDGIGWIPERDGKNYVVKDELSSELQSKLLEWIEQNLSQS